MKILIFTTKQEMGIKAAADGAELIRKAITEQSNANIILATGASQLEMLSALVKQEVDWTKVKENLRLMFLHRYFTSIHG